LVMTATAYQELTATLTDSALTQTPTHNFNWIHIRALMNSPAHNTNKYSGITATLWHINTNSPIYFDLFQIIFRAIYTAVCCELPTCRPPDMNTCHSVRLQFPHYVERNCTNCCCYCELCITNFKAEKILCTW
jgi:hypothetical protein